MEQYTYQTSDQHAHSLNGRPQSTLSRRSSMSRRSQLIQKNTGPDELRPSDVLIARFLAWKHLVKNLITYFEGVADIESNTAKELLKLGGVIQVPFREGNQFLGEGGVQDIFYGVREKTRQVADHHANLAKTVEGSIVQHLQKLRFEIKAHIRNIQQDTGKLAASVAKERESSTKLLTELARSITMLKNTPLAVRPKEDPWFTNAAVARQFQKQVHEENALQRSIIIMQQNSEHFEEGVVRAIQMAWATFDEWNARASAQVQETWTSMGLLMRSVEPTTEWIAFASRAEYLLDPDTPMRNPLTIKYPGMDDPSVLPVHSGILERKKRYTKTYKEAYYVLTPAGYLHEFVSSDNTRHAHPEMSLFLPECTLGAPTSARAKSHKFYIEGKRAFGGDVGTKAGLFHQNASITFRARSHDEMLEWWNDIKQLSKVYLTASESLDRSGPVPAAVRAAGYISSDEEFQSEESDEEESEQESEASSEESDEEEEDEEDEEDGSSVEENAEDDEHEATTADEGHDETTAAAAKTEKPEGEVSKEEEVPSYSAPAEGSGVEVGKDGYAAEKKGGDAAPGESSSSSKPNASVFSEMLPSDEKKE